MRRFALSTIGRLVHPFSTNDKSAGQRGLEISSSASQHPSIERLHVERAHAVVQPVHLSPADSRRRHSFVNTVREIFRTT
jgi:hypothetical protein